MIFDEHIKKYIELLEILIDRSKTDEITMEKFIEVMDILKPTTTDSQVLDTLLEDYKDVLLAEQKAFNNFTNSMVTLNDAINKEDEIKSKIRDLMKKIQSESIDLIQEQIEK